MSPRKIPYANSAQSSLDEDIDRCVLESANTLRARDNHLYDGVLGYPPDWMPGNFRREFHEARNRLLDAGYNAKQVRDLMSREFRRDREAVRNSTNAVSYDGFLWPLSVRRDVRTLARLRTAVRLKREKGLAFLTDPTHANEVKKGEQYGRHQRGIAKNPRGKIEEAGGETINEIIGRLAKTMGDERAKDLWPHFYSKLDEHTLNPKEDKEKGVIEYDFKGRRKPITFGTFEKVVSQYRTGRKKLP
jgi:hypothetical protein